MAIIPFTWEVTNFHQIEKGTVVNIEFDILGKYIAKIVRQILAKDEIEAIGKQAAVLGTFQTIGL